MIGAHAVVACGIIVVSIFTAATTTVQIAGIGGDGNGGGSELKGVYGINKDVERARHSELRRLGSNRTEPRTQSQQDGDENDGDGEGTVSDLRICRRRRLPRGSGVVREGDCVSDHGHVSLFHACRRRRTSSSRCATKCSLCSRPALLYSSPSCCRTAPELCRGRDLAREASSMSPPSAPPPPPLEPVSKSA